MANQNVQDIAAGLYDSMLNEDMAPSRLAEAVKGTPMAEEALVEAVKLMQKDAPEQLQDLEDAYQFELNHNGIENDDKLRQEGYDAAANEFGSQMKEQQDAHGSEMMNKQNELDAAKYNGQMNAQNAGNEAYKQGMLARAKEDMQSSSNTMIAKDIAGRNA